MSHLWWSNANIWEVLLHLLSMWGIASQWGQSPAFQTYLGTVRWYPHPGSPGGAQWQQEDQGCLTHLCHRTLTSFLLAAHPCHRDGRSRLATRMLCPLAATAEGQGVKCCRGPWMGHLWDGRLCWWQMCATDGYMLFWPALIFLAGPLIARERYRQMQ